MSEHLLNDVYLSFGNRDHFQYYLMIWHKDWHSDEIFHLFNNCFSLEHENSAIPSKTLSLINCFAVFMSGFSTNFSIFSP